MNIYVHVFLSCCVGHVSFTGIFMFGFFACLFCKIDDNECACAPFLHRVIVSCIFAQIMHVSLAKETATSARVLHICTNITSV